MKSRVALVIAVLSVALHAQAAKPDFSGTWVMVSPQPGHQQTVKQDAVTLTVASGEGTPATTVIYKLDGTETRTVTKTDEGERVIVSKASWTGSQLAIASTLSFPEGKIDQVILWSINDQAQLVIEVRNSGFEPMRMIYRKKTS